MDRRRFTPPEEATNSSSGGTPSGDGEVCDFVGVRARSTSSLRLFNPMGVRGVVAQSSGEESVWLVIVVGVLQSGGGLGE